MVFRPAGSRRKIAPRFSSTKPSSENCFSIRATASRAELMCFATSSWVMRMTEAPVRSASCTKKAAKRRSSPRKILPERDLPKVFF